MAAVNSARLRINKDCLPGTRGEMRALTVHEQHFIRAYRRFKGGHLQGPVSNDLRDRRWLNYNGYNYSVTKVARIVLCL